VDFKTRPETMPHCRLICSVISPKLLLRHLPETEKYAHITFFFNGGVEKQFPKEDRHMIPSPKVPTYDKQPEMSVQSVADKVAEVVKAKEYEFVMCNFAPPDMVRRFPVALRLGFDFLNQVGHTGVYEAAVKAITATDAAVGTVASACVEAGYVLLITADHGNAEQMLNPDTGDPHTAHTTNPVPLIVKTPDGHIKFAKDKDDQEEGALCDVAPTILDIMVRLVLLMMSCASRLIQLPYQSRAFRSQMVSLHNCLKFP
jgi:2,3-bisphosphoglycerate-independent phosphoglycerate mutase